MILEPCSSSARTSISFDNGEKTDVSLAFNAAPAPSDLPVGYYLESEGHISINPGRYREILDLDGAGWRLIPTLGRMGPALLSMPIGKEWPQNQAAPSVSYGFRTRQAGDHIIEFHLAPRNPGVRGVPDRLRFSLNNGEVQVVETVSRNYYTEGHNQEWNKAVMDNIRKVSVQTALKAGDTTLTLYASGPGIILEKIVVYPAGTPLPASYLGPPESWFKVSPDTI